MTITLQIDPPFQQNIDAKRLQELAQDALEHCQRPDAEMTIVITTDEAIQALNRQYRGVDAPTDVLSFAEASPADDFALPEQPSPWLGDVIISAPGAARQAQTMGHTLFEEIQLLSVHGILHLLGYEHLTPAEKEIMWRKQAEILRLNNLSHVQPTEK
ncbi:MAG TPA: rRNA maturation RNase YbeY [Chloroflexi bacterium]|nr:rRNA maturation RNase YbeY [Chloroflexota bacterium]